MKPRDLPRLRAQTIRHLEDPSMPVRAGTEPGVQPALDAAASHLRVADLYWVAADMAALAVHSGAQLASASWATADRPAGCGLLWWQDGLSNISWSGVQIPIEAMSWGPHRGELLVWLWISRRTLDAEITARARAAGGEPSFTLVHEEIPPLLPVSRVLIPMRAEPVPFAAIDGQPVALQALAAAWLIMHQPQLVDRSRERADGPLRRAAARAALSDPDVTVVDLRRQYTPQDRDGAETDGRTYRHRWIVSGHWRQQPYGPDRALRRQTWIPAHIKGPDGAPMLATEKVNVWRR